MLLITTNNKNKFTFGGNILASANQSLLCLLFWSLPVWLCIRFAWIMSLIYVAACIRYNHLVFIPPPLCWMHQSPDSQVYILMLFPVNGRSLGAGWMVQSLICSAPVCCAPAFFGHFQVPYQTRTHSSSLNLIGPHPYWQDPIEGILWWEICSGPFFIVLERKQCAWESLKGRR